MVFQGLHNSNHLTKMTSKTSFINFKHQTLSQNQKPYFGWPIWPGNQTSKMLTQHAEYILSMLSSNHYFLNSNLKQQAYLKWLGIKGYRTLLHWLPLHQRLKTINFKWTFKLPSENRLLTCFWKKMQTFDFCEMHTNFDQNEIKH